MTFLRVIVPVMTGKKEKGNFSHERLLTSSPGYEQCIIALTGFFFFGSGMRGAPLRHVEMCEELCGADALQRL
jgi:hypothetical protein